MNSLVFKVFSNFKEFYSEINGATLTGAIDVIVVEQPDGTFLCSPFHVRFGKLGVLRSREKIVDIEVNGEPVDIHMKLGETGEAFFVEKCEESDANELPEHLATSPLPTDDFSTYMNDKLFENEDVKDEIPVLRPRRNSIDFSTEAENSEKKFENQSSNYSNRRHTDNTMERRDLTAAKKEYTTQKIRQEWAEHEDKLFGNDAIKHDNDIHDSVSNTDLTSSQTESINIPLNNDVALIDTNIIQQPQQQEQQQPQTDIINKDDSKAKKKRRRKSMIKKKNAQRKGSSSSSIGSTISDNNNEKTTESSTSESTKIEVEEGRKINDSNSVIANETTQSIGEQKSSRIRDLDIHFFSDTELASGKSPQSSRPPTPIQSDSEFEISQRGNCNAESIKDSASWKWGELPTTGGQLDHSVDLSNEDSKQAQRNSMLSSMFSFMKQTKKLRKNNQSDGIYLSDIDPKTMDPKIAALYFPSKKSATNAVATESNFGDADNVLGKEEEDDNESGNGTSLIHSPSSLGSPKSGDSDFEDGKQLDNRYLDFVALSLCGGLGQNGPTDEQFNQNIVQYLEVCQNPSIFSSPLLVVRLNQKYYSWAAACPIVMSILAFQKPLSSDAIEQIINATKPQDISIESERKRGYSSWWYWRRSENKSESKQRNNFEQKPDGNQLNKRTTEFPVDVTTSTMTTAIPIGINSSIIIEHSELSEEFSRLSTGQDGQFTKINELFKKSLKLSSDQIAGLNLKNGINEISFSVTTAYQGTTRCKCYLFKWKHSDKVVISDIDGTITKSDVLGHILPMVGKDWAQIGVAQLFSKIKENGYKLLYLSARAIGQSNVTREYLRSIRQGDVKLPDGPLLLNPTSLMSALHREIIEKNPEQFKIKCLNDIQALFPNKKPFYAGYGNKINDVWAYRAVGIPIMRIFTINPKGELKHELTQTFQSSYCNMTYIVDQLFPPTNTDIEESIEFSNINYWREPFIDIDMNLINTF